MSAHFRTRQALALVPEALPLAHPPIRSLAPALAVLVASVGCTTRYIGNTQVEDTEENRAILLVIEQYRRAVEDRDIQRILDLTSEDFFEDPGTPGDPSDDYDKRGLRQKLEESFSRIADQRLRIDVRKLHQLDRDRVAVEYRFDYRYKLALPSAPEWREFIDVNRVVLVREGEQWRFLSGL
ncbi:MAG: nuclear transport factor 2 family protein [Pseudomonadota bacterium]